MPTEFHIGIDDTDSRFGGCTTYTASLAFDRLVRHGYSPLDFPWLVRLNPNIPWKTRGNGALALHFEIQEEEIESAKQIVLEIVRETSDPSMPSTDPGVVFLEGKPSKALQDFSDKALYDVLSVSEARKIVRQAGAESHSARRKSRGIIGALAAVGSRLAEFTFEIVAYRTREKLGTKRLVDSDSVKKMDSECGHSTFNNLDPESGRILISPHGPDPVLFGIRGDSPRDLITAFQRVRVLEPIERVTLFKTNHGTDSHLTHLTTIRELRPSVSAMILGQVCSVPKVLTGGHVIFKLSDGNDAIDCAAYEPSGRFRSTVKQLVPGDHLKAYGGVKNHLRTQSLTLNLEKMEILRLASDVVYRNPDCPACGATCESRGKSQGFRCRKCHQHYPGFSKIQSISERHVNEGVFLPPLRSHRHLTRPFSRYSRVEAADASPQLS